MTKDRSLQGRDKDANPEKPERASGQDPPEATGNLGPLIRRLWHVPLFRQHRHALLISTRLLHLAWRSFGRHSSTARHQPPPPPIHPHRRHPPFLNQQQREHPRARLQPAQHAERLPAPREPGDELPRKDDVDRAPEAGEAADEAGGEAAVGEEPLCREGEDEGDDEGLAGAVEQALWWREGVSGKAKGNAVCLLGPALFAIAWLKTPPGSGRRRIR
jgi:hypothetical protein